MEAPAVAKAPECPIKRELLEGLQSAYQQLSALQKQEMAALVADDLPGVKALTTKMENARILREQAMDAFRDHVQEHGC